MNNIEIKTEWWRRAVDIIEDRNFDYFIKELNSESTIQEYLDNPEEVIASTRYRYKRESSATEIYENTLKIFLASSIEIEARDGHMDNDLQESFKNIADIFYRLFLIKNVELNAKELLLKSSICFEIAGYTANSIFALNLREKNIQELKPEMPELRLILLLLLARRFSELRILVHEWKYLEEISFIERKIVDFLINLDKFFLTGNIDVFEEIKIKIKEIYDYCLKHGNIEDWFYSRCIDLLIIRFEISNNWIVLKENLEESLNPLWEKFIRRLYIGSEKRKSNLIRDYVQSKNITDLWTSQINAIRQGILTNETNDILLKMPTSAGKTRLAEFKIIQSLINDPEKLCIYIVPFLSLANETVNTLRNSLGSIGVRIADAFQGEYELTSIDEEFIEYNNVIITTPEKLDLIIRRKPEILKKIGLFIFDEGHLIEFNSRGVRFEFLINRLKRLRTRHEDYNYQLTVISAVVPNADELAKWITGSTENLINVDWKPTNIKYGVFHWEFGNEVQGNINFPDDKYYIKKVINRRKKRRNRNSTRDRYDIESANDICAYLAKNLINSGAIIIFAPTPFKVQKRVAKSINKLCDKENFKFPTTVTARKKINDVIELSKDYLGDDHPLIDCLKNGFAYHTGQMPNNIRKQIENLYQNGNIKLLVCTNTVAQGVNFPVKTLIIHSTKRDDQNPNSTIASKDFINMSGRVARAIKEKDGQVIFIHQNRSKIFNSEENLLKNQFNEKNKLVSCLITNFARLLNERFDLNINAFEITDENEETIESLYAQLLGVLVEEIIENDDFDIEEIFRDTLFNVQLQNYNVPTEEIYADLKHLILSIKEELPEESRKLFFQSGLSVNSCKSIIAFKDDFIAKAVELVFTGNNADINNAKELIELIYNASISSKETKPRIEYDGLFEIFWDWLNGKPVKDIESTLSRENLSKTIEDLFVRKIPWGINSLYVLSGVEFDNIKAILPDYILNLPVFARYGVSNILAAKLLMLGIPDRDSAIKLATNYPETSQSIEKLSNWLLELSKDDLSRILSENKASFIYDEIRKSQLGNIGANKLMESDWNHIEIKGIDHYYPDVVITERSEFSLKREPQNPYDINAIEVYLKENDKIGYIDRNYARILAPLMDSGIELSAKFNYFEPIFNELYVDIKELF